MSIKARKLVPNGRVDFSTLSLSLSVCFVSLSFTFVSLCVDYDYCLLSVHKINSFFALVTNHANLSCSL